MVTAAQNSVCSYIKG